MSVSFLRSMVFGSALAIFVFFLLGRQKTPHVPMPHAIKPHSQRVLVPLPSHGFDPTEAVYPWSVLSSLGYDVMFATPTGTPSAADPVVLSSAIFKPPPHILQLYEELRTTPAFISPLTFDELAGVQFDGLMLIGGHHPAMSTYLDDERVHDVVRRAFAENKVVGMICHGVLAALRTNVSVAPPQADPHTQNECHSESILAARNASFTFLPKHLERIANVMSEYLLGLKDYQLATTHGHFVQDEIQRRIRDTQHFHSLQHTDTHARARQHEHEHARSQHKHHHAHEHDHQQEYAHEHEHQHEHAHAHGDEHEHHHEQRLSHSHHSETCKHDQRNGGVLVHPPFDLLAPLIPGGPRDHRHAFVVVDQPNRLVSARFWGDAYLFGLWMAESMQQSQHQH